MVRRFTGSVSRYSIEVNHLVEFPGPSARLGGATLGRRLLLWRVGPGNGHTRNMDLPIYPLAGEFAAEIGDVDLRSETPPATMEVIRAAFGRYAVLVFPQQQLDSQQ